MKLGSYENIILERLDQVTTITLNRPEKKNAMSPELHVDMLDAVRRLEEDDETRVIVLTGAGDSFCAGQDLKKMFLEKVDTPLEKKRVSKVSIEWGKRFRVLPKPTIAAVNGWCFGGGLRIMALCDFAIASEKAVFGLSEINFASFPSAGAMWAPLQHLHPRDLLYLAMTGEAIDAHQAEQMRLINRAVSHERLKEEVLKLAETLKKKDPIALMACKEAYNLTRRLDYDDAIDWEMAKAQEKTYFQQGVWTKALSSFAKKEYKPGLGEYREEQAR